MPAPSEQNVKLYYSIREVARMFNVNESLIRFWEKEFPDIHPQRNAKGTRQYRKEDIESIKLVYHLVKEKGMTLDGARKRLKDNKRKSARTLEVIERLKSIKEELMEMKKELDAI